MLSAASLQLCHSTGTSRNWDDFCKVINPTIHPPRSPKSPWILCLSSPDGSFVTGSRQLHPMQRKRSPGFPCPQTLSPSEWMIWMHRLPLESSNFCCLKQELKNFRNPVETGGYVYTTQVIFSFPLGPLGPRHEDDLEISALRYFGITFWLRELSLGGQVNTMLLVGGETLSSTHCPLEFSMKTIL